LAGNGNAFRAKNAIWLQSLENTYEAAIEKILKLATKKYIEILKKMGFIISIE
jgi:hypothetical protein